MVKRSLSGVLQVQWWIHTAITSLFFISLTFFFLFIIEDYYHEQQLRDLSHMVSVQQSFAGIPPHISGFDYHQVPEIWLDSLAAVPLGKAQEISGENGHQIHLVQQLYQGSSDRFVLVLDTEKTRSIWRNMDKLAVLIVPWTLLFFSLASWMTHKFIRQLHGQFIALLNIIKHSESPSDLAQYRQTQPVEELADYAAYFERVWQDKLDVIAREREGLAYLSHELRTPIQSSIATLELLALKHQDKSTIERLMRSLKRMTRLSNGVLCLMASDTVQSAYPVVVNDICEELLDEFTPLVRAKNQTIAFAHSTEKATEVVPKVSLNATREAVETLLSILIMNAIQHSDQSPIFIGLSSARITITNRAKAEADHHTEEVQTTAPMPLASYGIGLVIARRLAQRFELCLEMTSSPDGTVTAQLSQPTL